MATILIIDDSAFQRKIIRDIIEAESHNILEASDGKEGLEMIIDQKPDLILLDHTMPEKTGRELMNDIKNKEIDIPTIMITADIQEGSRQQSMDLGVKAFIGKPVNEEELKKLIRQYC